MKALFLPIVLSIGFYGCAMNSIPLFEEQVDKNFWLMIFTETRCHDAVELLLDHGADIQTRTSRGNMPLHRAAFNADYRLMKLLLEWGAPVNARNGDGATPLHSLIASGNVKRGLVKLLLDYGAQLDAPDLTWHTPLHYAGFILSPLSAKNLLEEYLLHMIDTRYKESLDRIICLLWSLKQKGVPRQVAHLTILNSPSLRRDVGVILAKHMLKQGPKALERLRGTSFHPTFDACYIARLLVSLAHKDIDTLTHKRSRYGRKAYHSMTKNRRGYFLPETACKLMIPVIKDLLLGEPSQLPFELPTIISHAEEDYKEGVALRKYFMELLPLLTDEDIDKALDPAKDKLIVLQ